MSYPPDFQSWPQERRNAWFAAEGRAYRETKAPGNGAADHANLQGGFDGFDSSLGKGFPQNNGAWPEPKPIESALPPVAPFDAELLPRRCETMRLTLPTASRRLSTLRPLLAFAASPHLRETASASALSRTTIGR